MKLRVLVPALLALATYLNGLPVLGQMMQGRFVEVRRLYDDLTLSGPLTIRREVFVYPGVELASFGVGVVTPGIFDVDISNARILITAALDQPFMEGDHLRFADSRKVIPRFTDVSVNPVTSWSGFNRQRLAITDDEIIVKLSGLTALKGQQILLDVEFIPEPSCGMLALVSFAAILRRSSQRRCHAICHSETTTPPMTCS